MLLTNHTLTGLTIGLVLKQPLLIAPVALASHFVLDCTPHFGGKFMDFKSSPGRYYAAVDCFVALHVALAAAYIWPQYFWALVTGVFFATVPDLLYIPRYLMGIKFWQPLFTFHRNLQQRSWSETPYGAITEIVWGAGMVFMMSRYL